AKVRSAGPALDDAAYAKLAKPSHAVPPTTYRSVVPKLFETIITDTKKGPEKRTSVEVSPPDLERGG
ncbi:MAG: COX aromatic rich motif-containing protein, partial [Stellaceae bacterium]